MLRLFTRKNFEKLVRNPAHAMKMGKQKILTHAAASWLGGRSFFPANITFFLTYRCNLRCNVCGQWGVNGYVRNNLPHMVEDELDLAVLKRVVDQIAPYSPQITLCGGEVLLYPGWYEFLSHAKSKGLSCVLTTNGTMLEENAEKLVRVGIDKVSLSLDGPEDIHNRARGTANGFRRAINGITALNRVKGARGAKNPTLEIGCTISDQNCHHLQEVVDIAESLEVSCLIFLHLCFLTEGDYERQAALFTKIFQTESIHWGGYRYSPGKMDLGQLATEIERIKSERHKMPVIFHPDFGEKEMADYYTSSSFRPTSYESMCLAPWTTVYVFPNGDVSPCSSFVAGNLREKAFKDIWNGKSFRHFRNELRKRGSFPVCIRCCEFYKH